MVGALEAAVGQTAVAARVGVAGIGLAAYWPQFPGMKDEIERHLHHVGERIGRWAKVVGAGLIDTAAAGREAGDRLSREDLDLVVIYAGTYATSTQVLPIVQRTRCPVLILNLPPLAALDYAATDTMTLLANCGVCSVPEMAGVFARAGIAYQVITGALYDDERAWRDVERWCRAAGVARTIRSARFGMLGHTYPGMIDMSTDVGMVHTQLGTHVEILEIDDLKDRVEAATASEIAEMGQRAERLLAPAHDISSEAMDWGARVAVGLDRLATDFDLDGLAYYYRGTGGDRIERIASAMVLGNTLLTARGIPAAGEGDLKTAIAMKIMHELDAGGSFSEFFAMDFQERFFLMGHDGPAHVAISDGKPTLKELKLFHGKAGGGLSVEMRAQTGPVTILGLAQNAHGRLTLIVAEGESLPGPVLQIGNSNHRLRFGKDLPEFMDAWCALGPTHHVALGLGHRLGDIRLVARMLDVPLETV